MLSAILLAPLTGCRIEDDIKLETITHEDREPLRLRVAVLHLGDKDWFIRVDGPTALVKEYKPAFDAFVRSAQFDEKKDKPLTWTEPKEWKKDPPMPGRYASFRIPAKPKDLEVKVTVLAGKGKVAMADMHRWQKQVNVPLSEAAADNDKYITREKIDGIGEVEWIDLNGLGVHTVSDPKADAGADRKEMMGGFEMDQPRMPFNYAVPEKWVKQPPGQFAFEAYKVSDGDKTAEVTITPLGGQMGANVVANMNRWRDQVKLEPLDGNALQKTMTETRVAGYKAYYADIANPAHPKNNHILGVMVLTARRSAWSIKMTGPLDFVAQNKNAFDTFVQSFKKDAR